MRYIFLLAIFFSTIARGQVTSFFQQQFNGGVTGCGYGPGYNAAGTGTLTISIAPHSSIYKAWLFAGREGEAAPVTVTFNGTSLTFNSSNQVSNTFESPDYGGESAVHGIDVTSLIDSSVNTYSLYVPLQNNGYDDNVYTDFYLYVAYANNSLPPVTGCIFLNDADFGTDIVDTFILNYPIDNAYPAALAGFLGYCCNSGDNEEVFINGNRMGPLYGPNDSSGSCTGPYGDFAYKNETFTGLLDCNANQPMRGPNAISNFQLLVDNCASDLTCTFTAGDQSNALWAFFITYSASALPYNLDTAVCNGIAVQLNTNAADTVTWAPSSALSCNTCANPVATPGVTTTYTGSFISCNTALTDTFTINIYSTPLNLQANPAALCAGDTVYLSAGGDTVNWYSTAALGCAVCATSFSVPDTSVIYYASAVCAGADSIAVTVYPLPVVHAGADTNRICSNDSLLICADSGFAGYAWNTGQSGVCIYTSNAGNYYLTATDDHGCAAQSNHFALSVSAASPVSASVSGDTLTVYNSALVQWYFDGQPIPGATSPVYIAHAGGTYVVQVTDTNGCQSLSNGLVITSVDDIAGYNISVYPNPAGDYVMLDFDPACAGGIIILEDITGRKILQTHLTASPQQLPVADLPPGAYVISLVVNGRVETKLLVKN